MIFPHELFGVIYTHFRSFFFEYVAPCQRVIDEFWEQAAGVMDLMCLSSLLTYDSYESWFSFDYGGPELLTWNPILICFLMLLKKLCEGSPQFANNPTIVGRNLKFMLPLSFHGDGTPVSGAGKS